MLNGSSRTILQLDYIGSFPDIVPFEPQLTLPASKFSIDVLHSDLTWLFFKRMKVKKHNLNNYEIYMNLRSKTPSNVRTSIKGNFPIKTSKL